MTPDGRRATAQRFVRSAVAAVALAGFGCSESASEPEAGFVVLVDEVSAGHEARPPPPDPRIWETPLSDPALESGRLVWTGTCIQCHSTGLGGAPLIGNADLWRPRIEKGLDGLVENATRGFYGDVGEMPARGGNPDLTDDDIRHAVRFMASRVDPTI